ADAVTVIVHVAVLPEEGLSEQVVKISPLTFELNVTVPVGLLLVPDPTSATLIVKFWVPPGATVADVGSHDVVVGRLGVRVMSTELAVPPLATLRSEEHT